jgi:glyoxylase-like metal-dependent hydrolase (beta-lactamase superfamily II)
MRNDGIDIKDIDVVVNTHMHLDHCESNPMFTRHGALLSFHRDEPVNIKPDITLSELESESIEVIHTPGHSPGSIVIYISEYEAVISGDLIFENGLPGRTDLYGSSKSEMAESLELIQSYEPKYIFPGHGRVVEGREGIRALFDKAMTILER